MAQLVRTLLYPVRLLGRLLALLVFNPLFERLGAGSRHSIGPGSGVPSLQEVLGKPARVMWVAAHPDDESFCGSLLAYVSLTLGNPLHMVVLTRGDGGESSVPIPEGKTLADLREAELHEVARLYKCSLSTQKLFNASLPVESFPRRHEIAERWKNDYDPAVFIAGQIREFKPDIVLTFAPRYGATGHPEHQLTSRFCLAGIRLAAEENQDIKGTPYLVPNTYFILMRYWFLRLFGMRMDPFPYTDTFNVRTRCTADKTCVQVMAANTLPHKTQSNDMGQMRVLSSLLYKQYLYRVDPFSEFYDPYEPVARGGIGTDI